MYKINPKHYGTKHSRNLATLPQYISLQLFQGWTPMIIPQTGNTSIFRNGCVIGEL